MDYFKNNYLILIIKFLILALFAWSFCLVTGNLYDIWHFDWVLDSKALMDNEHFQNSLIRNLKPILVTLIPFIGIFFNNKFGWTLISSFIYFIISFIVFSTMDTILKEKPEVSEILIFISILIIPLILINIKKIRHGTYGISKTEMIIMNIGSSVIGMGMTILLTYLNK